MADLDFPEMTAAECREYAERLRKGIFDIPAADRFPRYLAISGLIKYANKMEQSQ